MEDLLVATTNQGKFVEISAFFKGLPFRLQSLRDLSGAPSVMEDGETFLENARKKAHALARWSGRRTLADDSGIVVEVLGGRPGVHSARYAGETATDEDNRRKLLAELEGVPEGKRGAAFVCVLVLAHPDGRELVAEGRVEGRITTVPRGSGGFGYDPLFFVPSLGKTTAELGLQEKNGISHRGRALRLLKDRLQSASFKK
ncbi:MAG TPA: XTP/dITP diphosphatase [bacterium]|nr:XTP/dITP diphosphatase [bacterium]